MKAKENRKRTEIKVDLWKRANKLALDKNKKGIYLKLGYKQGEYSIRRLVNEALLERLVKEGY